MLSLIIIEGNMKGRMTFTGMGRVGKFLSMSKGLDSLNETFTNGMGGCWLACSLRLLTAPLYPATYQCTVGSESHCDKHHAPHVQPHKLMQQHNHYFQQQLNKSERGTASKDNLTGQNDVSDNISWPDIEGILVGNYKRWFLHASNL